MYIYIYIHIICDLLLPREEDLVAHVVVVAVGVPGDLRPLPRQQPSVTSSYCDYYCYHDYDRYYIVITTVTTVITIVVSISSCFSDYYDYYCRR